MRPARRRSERSSSDGCAIKAEAKTVSDPDENKRLEIQATALKLVLNSTFGKLGDSYSSLFDYEAFLAVTLSGQLMLIDLIERLTEAKVQVISANTDGLFLRVPRNGKRWRKVLARWQRDTEMKLEVDSLKRLAILATNCFATLDARGKVKRKGAELKDSLSPVTAPNALVVNDAIAEALLTRRPTRANRMGLQGPGAVLSGVSTIGQGARRGPGRRCDEHRNEAAEDHAMVQGDGFPAANRPSSRKRPAHKPAGCEQRQSRDGPGRRQDTR